MTKTMERRRKGRKMAPRNIPPHSDAAPEALLSAVGLGRTYDEAVNVFLRSATDMHAAQIHSGLHWSGGIPVD